MKRFIEILMVGICILLVSLYIYPIFSGLVLLPLDLLVSNSTPWLYANTILLKNPHMLDSVIQMVPWKHLTFMCLTSGILPLWNPYQLTGMPFMASMKSLVFYPGNLLFFLGELRSWNALLWIQLFVSLWGTYRLMRLWGVHPIAAILSGIAFAFSSLMMAVLEFGSEGQVLMFLPWMLYTVTSYIRNERLHTLTALAVFVLFALLGGHLQYLSYICLLTIAYAVFLSRLENKPHTFFPMVLSMIFGIMMGALQLLPGMRMFFSSYRSAINDMGVFSGGMLQTHHFLKFLSPDWFGNPVSRDLRWGYIEASGYFGIIPFLLSLFALFYLRKDRFVRFFVWVFAITMLFSTTYIGPILWYLHIPLITSGYGGRLIILSIFSGSILAGFGLQAFLSHVKEISWNIFVYRFVVTVLLIFAVCVVSSPLKLPFWVSLSNVKLQIAILCIFFLAWILYQNVKKFFRHAPVFFAMFLVLLTYADLFRMGYRFLTFSNPKFFYPVIPVISFLKDKTQKDLGRVYGLTDAEIYSHFQIPSMESYNPLFPFRSGLFMQALEGKGSGAYIGNAYTVAQNERMKYVMDFLGVTYIATEKDKNPALELWKTSRFENDIRRLYKDDRNEVFENLTAYPRFALYYHVFGNASDAEILDHIRKRDIDFRSTLFISDPVEPIREVGVGTVMLQSWNENTVSLVSQSSTPAYLYLSDAYDPDWTVTVNGKREKLLRANFNFRAVFVPAGTATVTFAYQPKSFRYGLIISGISVMLWLVFLKKVHQKNTKRHDGNRNAGSK